MFVENLQGVPACGYKTHQRSLISEQLNKSEPKRDRLNLSSDLSYGEATKKLIPYKKFEPDGNHGHHHHKHEVKGNPNGLNVTQFIILNSNWTRSKT